MWGEAHGRGARGDVWVGGLLVSHLLEPRAAEALLALLELGAQALLLRTLGGGHAITLGTQLRLECCALVGGRALRGRARALRHVGQL